MPSWWLKKVLRLRRDVHLFMTQILPLCLLCVRWHSVSGGTAVTMMHKVFAHMECSFQGVCSSLSSVQLSATPWTVAHQTPLSMGFPRQEYWISLPFPSPGDSSDPWIEPMSPASANGFFTTKPPGIPIYRYAASWLLQSCPALCNPMDCSPPGSSVHGIFQARILECVAISFSRRSSQPRD